jgi:hypothetical protein
MCMTSNPLFALPLWDKQTQKSSFSILLMDKDHSVIITYSPLFTSLLFENGINRNFKLYDENDENN